MAASELQVGLVLPEGSSGDAPPSPARARHTDMKYKHARLLIQGKTPSDLLADRIRSDGMVIGDTLKVNSFINHQVDCHLMSVCGHELARRFRGMDITKVFTSHGSGIMPAQACAMHMNVPLVFAQDVPPLHLENVSIYEDAVEGSSVARPGRVMYVSSEFIGPGDRLLIVDDMLAKGGTTKCLVSLAGKCGASVVACGFMIEKEFDGGRSELSKLIPKAETRVQSLVKIRSISGGVVDFVEG